MKNNKEGKGILSKPDWIIIRSHASTAGYENETFSILDRYNLNTVCNEAYCPNRGECYGRHTAAFIILGRHCTRNCTFCNVAKHEPSPVDPDEPANLAAAVRELNLTHVVVTSVTRDDLPDGGASQFVRVVEEVRKAAPQARIELLIPDFAGNEAALRMVVEARPDVINHNLETVPRLYPEVRPMANYGRSLNVLRLAKTMSTAASAAPAVAAPASTAPEQAPAAASGRIFTKSGIMLGLGEEESEVMSLLHDLRAVDCDFLTIGQYLRPSKNHIEVREYVHPDVFEAYRVKALEMGFLYVASGPFVRSSYHADEAMNATR